MSKSDPDSRSEELENVIPWTEEFNEDELALAQSEMEEEFGINFEETDYDLKGVSEIELEPFYTGIDDTFEIYGAPVNISIEETDIGYGMEYWSDDFEALGELSEWLGTGPGEEENEIECMQEPYEFRDIKDTEIAEIIRGFKDRTVLEGPVSRPGKGQVREYPVRIEHLDLGKEEGYSGKGTTIVGDGAYTVNGLLPGQPPREQEPEGKIYIRPVKTEDGLYNLSVEADDLESLGYMMDQVRKTVSPRTEDSGGHGLEL